MFEVDVNGLTQQYRTKPTMNADITKPLTYDYMPEGYPSKSIGLVTLVEEQEVTFSSDGFGAFMAVSPVALDVKMGDKLTVVWDGVSYDVIAKELEENVGFGNLAILNPSMESTGEPFIYTNAGSIWFTADNAASHTIKVMRQQATITPMSTDFIPKNFNVVFSGINSIIPDSCNVTYDELRGWIENGTPVFATYKVKQDDGSVSAVGNIVTFKINTDKLTFYYETGASMAGFVYKSDGTFSGIKS